MYICKQNLKMNFMMKKRPLITLLSALLFVGCVNNDYDLSDIDSTARFNFNDLVIPINVDGVTLKKVMDLNESSKIKVVDGEYAVVEDGSFKSNKIEVASFQTKAPLVSPILATLDLTSLMMAKGESDGENLVGYYNFSDESTTFTIEAHDVDTPVRTIKSAKVDATIDLIVNVTGLNDCLNVIRFEGIKIHIMKGLAFSRISTPLGDLDPRMYNPETGILDLSFIPLATTGTLGMRLYLSDIDADLCGMKYSNPDLEITTTCKVTEGRIAIYGSDIKPGISVLPEKIGFRADIAVSPVSVLAFTGKMQYDLTGLDINPVILSDIPDFLNQPSTDIKLDNPQIYLQFNNPLIQQGYDLYATTGFRLTANRTNAAPKEFLLDDEQELLADEAKNVYVLSPEDPAGKYYQGYENPEHIGFKSLSNVLSGDGLPESISIDALNPQLPTQDVTDFRLGNVFNPVEGTYHLFAPLKLKEGASIIYTDSIDGWNDEDLDALTIESLSLSMLATTDVTLNMNLKIYPIILQNGRQQIDRSIVGTAHISSLAQGEQVNVVMSGEIKHLDGIYIEANLDAAQDGGNTVLKPDMKIDFANLKVKASGYYEKEL